MKVGYCTMLYSAAAATYKETIKLIDNLLS